MSVLSIGKSSCPARKARDARGKKVTVFSAPLMTEPVALVDNGKTEHIFVSRYWMKATDQMLLVCGRQ